MEIECRQRPYPPLWYATTNVESVPWAAQQGFNLMGWAPAPALRASTDRYQEVWAKHRGEPDRLNGHIAQPRIGVARQIYVDTNEERALREARGAYQGWFDSFNKLWLAFGDSRHTARGDFEAVLKQGMLLIGTPDTIRRQIAQLLEESGCNYLALVFAWGGLTHTQALSSMKLFVEEVMPAFATLCVDIGAC